MKSSIAVMLTIFSVILSVIVLTSSVTLAFVPVVPSWGVAGALLGGANNLKTNLSRDDSIIKEVMVYNGAKRLNYPITLIIDGNSKEYFYFVLVRFKRGQPSDSWWERIGYIITPVLATEDEFRNLRRGDGVKIYYKPGYWPFFVSESK